jgi:hypothetical protein
MYKWNYNGRASDSILCIRIRFGIVSDLILSDFIFRFARSLLLETFYNLVIIPLLLVWSFVCLVKCSSAYINLSL